MLIALITTLIVVNAAQAFTSWRMARRVRATERIDHRLSQVADALALLTDTTEAGLASVANELEQSGRRRVSRARDRQAATRRIVAGVRRGRAIHEIAAAEALSESEVRLHLDMASFDAKGQGAGALRA